MSGEHRIPSDTVPMSRETLDAALEELRAEAEAERRGEPELADGHAAADTIPPPARETCVTCPRCAGSGTIRLKHEESATAHADVYERDPCWLCGGDTVVSVTTRTGWICAGRPETKPEGWDDTPAR